MTEDKTLCDEIPYQQPKEFASSELVIQRSRFVGFIYPVETIDEAQTLIERTQQTYHDARHICYAWRIGAPPNTVERFYDAGEPGRTAGYPMWQLLEGGDIYNALIIAVRYFGGIKLGTGGLARAYRDVARAAIEQSTIMRVVPERRIGWSCSYALGGKIDHFLEGASGVRLIDKQFTEHVHYVIAVDFREFVEVRQQLSSILQCSEESFEEF